MSLRWPVAVSAVIVCLGGLVFTTTGPSAAVTDDVAVGVWPLVPRPKVVTGFDPPAQDWHSGHRGVDLAGTSGQEVRAAQAGDITYAGRLAGVGIVVVSHGATRTTYQPVVASVRVGQSVAAGQVIGALHAFGSHCWPRVCLHWGLVSGEKYLDPLTLVGAEPVRLLPLLTSRAVSPSLAAAVTESGPVARSLRRADAPDGMPGAVGQW